MIFLVSYFNNAKCTWRVETLLYRPKSNGYLESPKKNVFLIHVYEKICTV